MARHAAIAMRNNKMNKTWLFTTLTLALVAAAPAHAISAKYREQPGTFRLHADDRRDHLRYS